MGESQARRARVERLLEAARLLRSPEHSAGQRLRRRLLETSGLSAENIELGLTRCLETDPSSEALQSLLGSTPWAPHAHVLLSGNVCVAALRAIVLGVAASERVSVRASRRDPALAEALCALRPELFELTSSLRPEPGDHLWCYGSDQTLATVCSELPHGVRLHLHGSGVGAVVVEPRLWTERDARALALDTALFDRRGCLSPHVVCVQGGLDAARGVAESVAGALAAVEQELPPGPSSALEMAQARRSRDAATYAFELFDAGTSWVSCGAELVLPPPGRILHVMPTPDAARCLAPWSRWLTCIATNQAELGAELTRAFPGARGSALGEMQCPPLDGPVDRRSSPLGVLS
jgi:hypothetical protein